MVLFHHHLNLINLIDFMELVQLRSTIKWHIHDIRYKLKHFSHSIRGNAIHAFHFIYTQLHTPFYGNRSFHVNHFQPTKLHGNCFNDTTNSTSKNQMRKIN